MLLGDNIGDLGMSEGLEHNSIIKIGFLSHKNPLGFSGCRKSSISQHKKKEKILLEKFKENYDVIILNDGSMDFVNDLIKEIKNEL